MLSRAQRIEPCHFNILKRYIYKTPDSRKNRVPRPLEQCRQMPMPESFSRRHVSHHDDRFTYADREDDGGPAVFRLGAVSHRVAACRCRGRIGISNKRNYIVGSADFRVECKNLTCHGRQRWQGYSRQVPNDFMVMPFMACPGADLFIEENCSSILLLVISH